MTDMERIHKEQAACVEYLAGDGPDKRGAAMGLFDWAGEEVLLLLEERGIVTGAPESAMPHMWSHI